MKAEQLVKKLGKQAKEKSEKQKEYKNYSEWPKCSKAGCPLKTTIKAENCTCTYHYRTHGLEADCITEALKEHVNYLNKYKEMQRWTTRQWKEKKPQIMGWPVLPATEFEMQNPTLYLNRFFKWIGQSIEERAEEIYQGR